MILTLKGMRPETLQELGAYLSQFRLESHQLSVDDHEYLVVAGDERQIDLNRVRNMPGVQDVNCNVHPYHFASRAFKPTSSRVRVGTAEFGGPELIVVAGPCAVEEPEDLLETARVCQAAGAKLLRAGAFKPRTTPHNFQGVGRSGVKLLAEVGQAVNLPIVTEVMDPGDVGWMEEYVDVFQVGTRNMTNSALLKRLGKTHRPVILKRSFSAKIEEWIRAAEFILVNGNPNVILCERGIQSCETYTRFTLDLSAVPAAKELTHLPVIVDPTHGTGKPSLIPPMARAAVAAGADGLLVEVHVAPERMYKPGDGPQALLPDQFRDLMRDIARYAALSGRTVAAG